MRVETLQDVTFMSGAVLSHLDLVLGRDCGSQVFSAVRIACWATALVYNFNGAAVMQQTQKRSVEGRG